MASERQLASVLFNHGIQARKPQPNEVVLGSAQTAAQARRVIYVYQQRAKLAHESRSRPF